MRRRGRYGICCSHRAMVIAGMWELQFASLTYRVGGAVCSGLMFRVGSDGKEIEV